MFSAIDLQESEVLKATTLSAKDVPVVLS